MKDSLNGIETIGKLKFMDIRNTNLKNINQLTQTKITRLMLTPKLLPKGWIDVIQAMPSLEYISTTTLEDLNQQTTTQFLKKLKNGLYDNK